MPNIVRNMKLLLFMCFLLFAIFLLQREFHSISSHLYSYKHLSMVIKNKNNAYKHVAMVVRTTSNAEKVDATPDDSFYKMMRSRIEYLESVCARHNNSGSFLTSDASLGISEIVDLNEEARLWLLKEEEVAWCPVPKAASTSWKINMLHFRASNEQIKSLIERYKVPERRLQHVGLVSPTIQEWKDYSALHTANLTSFIIVRHPFDRLVSSFRSIFESGWFTGIGYQIVRSLRHKLKNNRNFENQLFLATRTKLSEIKDKSKYPTFREFVKAVIRNKHYSDSTIREEPSLDVHWRPMYQQCSVCHPTKLSTLKYILKYENLAEEEAKFLCHLGWNSIIKQTVRSNTYNYKSKMQRNSSDIAKLYFNTLDKFDRYRLYKKYKLDFQLFNYSFKFSEW